MELPGSGFSTATVYAPAVEAVPVAVSCVEEVNVVERAVPLRRTCAPETKPVPVTAIEKLPRLVEAGEMPERVGVGFKSVTVLVPDLVASAVLVAVTVTVLGEGSTVGAE